VFGREQQGAVVVRQVLSASGHNSVVVVDKKGSWNSLRGSLKHSDSDTPPVGVNVEDDNVVVVRQITTAGDVVVPLEFKISSSHVRSRVVELRKSSSVPASLASSLHNELDAIVPGKVLDYIATHGLYTE